MVAVCAAALVAVIVYRAIPLKPAALLKRLPAKDSLIVAIDFAALRKTGVLQMLDDGIRARVHQSGVTVVKMYEERRFAAGSVYLDDLACVLWLSDDLAVYVQPVTD